MGGQDHPQFGDRVHAGGTNVWTETHHASGKNDRIMDGNRLVQRNEQRRVANGTNRQLERRSKDVERTTTRVKEARIRNKARFDRTHRLRLRKIEKGDWVLVYNSSLDNQHKSTRKFARHWFGPYMVRSVNDNATYHLANLDGTRITTPVAGKRIKAFKRRNEAEPNPGAESASSGEEVE